MELDFENEFPELSGINCKEKKMMILMHCVSKEKIRRISDLTITNEEERQNLYLGLNM